MGILSPGLKHPSIRPRAAITYNSILIDTDTNAGARSTSALLVVGLAAALLLVASTGAVVLDEPADRIDDDVALQPGDNPYAFLDENDELTIDVTEENPRIDAEGVNPDAFSAQRALFYITYDGDGHAEAWIDHDAAAVTFVVDGEPVESPEEATRLTPDDDVVPVAVEVDTRIVDVTPGDRLIDEISVHATTAEPESPSDADDSPSATSGPIVSMERPNPSVREVELRSVVGGGDTEIDLDELFVGDPTVRLDRLTFVRDAPGDVRFRVAGTTERPSDAASLSPGVDTLGFYTVAFADPDQPIDDATATIAFDRERLGEAGVEPDRLAVYRETDDGWVATETTVAETTQETVRIEAASQGFSAFAVAAERPALAPGDSVLSAETVASGEELHVDVTLANVGPAPATDEPAELRVELADAERSVATEPFAVDAAPGETATRSATLTVDEPGTYDLLVDGDEVTEPTVVGEVTVTESADAGATIGADIGDEGVGDADSGDADAVEEITGIGLSDLAGLVALVALVLATLLLVRRAPR